MYIHNCYASLLFKAFLFLLTGWGLYLHSGLPDKFNFAIFKYYTILSNLLCFLYFGAALVYGVALLSRGEVGDSFTLFPHFRGAITIGILVTMLIYQFLLADTPFSMGTGGGDLSDQIVHLFVPVLVLLDWLLFDAKGHYRLIDPFLWCVIPLVYWGYTLIAAKLGITYMAGSRYPYHFINLDQLGLSRVLGNVGGLLAAFLTLSFLIFGLDALLGQLSKA